MAKDKYHENVRQTLEKDGWKITEDPYFLMVGKRRGYIDLGAERIIVAEKGSEKIAVEVKSFIGTSDLDSFEDALGQFLIYLVALEEKDITRTLYLAVPEAFYERFFDDPFFLRLAQRFWVKMLVFNEEKNSIVQWINY
ncbi:MAG: element excision factor XisH family protein [Saprospiraceae bacterium]